jgi:hypothetical protein
MHAFNRRIRALALCALGAGALMVLPAPASAGDHSHLLKIYRVEQHLTLGGAKKLYEVKCHTGDFAIQGMWRVDNVDQDDDLSFFETYTHENASPAADSEWLTAVDVLTSMNKSSSGFKAGAGANDNHQNTWQFRFSKNAAGDVQMKLTLLCLGRRTEVNGHRHNWWLGGRQSGGTIEATPGDGQWKTGELEMTPASHPGACQTAGRPQVLVAPGFDQYGTSGSITPYGPWAHIYTNHWRMNGGNVDYRRWHWGFLVKDHDTATNPGGEVAVQTYYHCLHLKSFDDPALDHTHSIRRAFKKTSPNLPAQNMVKPQFREEQLHCGSLYKGVLGGFKIDPGHAFAHWVWYFGEDPRPKTRAFRFLNTTNSTRQVHLGLMCFHNRTT